MQELSWREKERIRKAALRYFEGLSTEQRFELGDALVLGDFDWMDWFERKPSQLFLRVLDDARIHWEMSES